MFIRRLTELGLKSRLLVPNAVLSHSKTCPTLKRPVCPGSGGGAAKGEGSIKVLDFKRAEKSAPCRLGFLPEDWFLFFHSKTGVTGPYLFGILLVNYCVSKEIFIMEHEYYSGLSMAPLVCFLTIKFGPAAGAILDKEVDAVADEWEKGRIDEVNGYETMIKAAKDAQWRAEGQNLLMEAKKENIKMQLEAAYRERFMMVFRGVKGRMDYHVKKYRAEARIHQKWMIGWILENVRKSITAEFEKQALDSAIKELAAVASRA